MVNITGKIILNTKDNSSIPHNDLNVLEKKEIFKHTELYLNGNGISTKVFPKKDGSFIIHNINPGPYLLTISSLHYQFSPIRVDVSQKDLGVVRMKSSYDNVVIKNGLIQPETKTNYFEDHQGALGIVYGLLSNPMILIMGGMMVLMTLLQKMDPEAMKELSKEASGNKKKSARDSMPHLLGK